MRRYLLALGIALIASLALLQTAPTACAQERDAPPKERPAEIDVDAPVADEKLGIQDSLEIHDDALLELSIEHREPTGTVTDDYVDDGFAPGLLIGAVGIMIIALLVAVVLLVVGTALLAAAIVITVGLGSAALVMGLASTSTFVGLSRRSFGAGFEALLSQTGAILGLPCGVAAAWVAYYLARTEFALDVSRTVSLVLGGLSGLAAGAVLGMLTARSVRLTASWVRGKLTPPSENALTSETTTKPGTTSA